MADQFSCHFVQFISVISFLQHHTHIFPLCSCGITSPPRELISQIKCTEICECEVPHHAVARDSLDSQTLKYIVISLFPSIRGKVSSWIFIRTSEDILCISTAPIPLCRERNLMQIKDFPQCYENLHFQSTE